MQSIEGVDKKDRFGSSEDKTNWMDPKHAMANFKDVGSTWSVDRPLKTRYNLNYQ